MNDATRERLAAAWVADGGDESYDTAGAAAGYLARIAGDPDRMARLRDLDVYRGITYQPGARSYTSGLSDPEAMLEEHALRTLDDAEPTVFTPAEQNWLEGRVEEENVDEYLRRKAPLALAAVEDWAHPVPADWELIATDPATGERVYAVPAPLPLPFLTPDELANGASESFEPVLSNLAYRGLRTLVVGQSKAGKSFLTWARSAEAVQQGVRVLYLSEEGRPTVADKLARFGLGKAGTAFRVLLRDTFGIRDLTWTELAVKLAEAVRIGRYDLVVVDTARPWFKMEGDDSNSADAIGRALDALAPVAGAGAAVVVLHQSPWSAKRARNSTEFHAASDLIFHVEGEGIGPRTVKYVGGRVEGMIPEIQTIRLDPAGELEDLGKARHHTATRMDEILRALEGADHPLTTAELEDLTDYGERSVQRYMARLEGRGKVRRHAGDMTPKGRTPDTWSRASLEAELYGGAEETDARP